MTDMWSFLHLRRRPKEEARPRLPSDAEIDQQLEEDGRRLLAGESNADAILTEARRWLDEDDDTTLNDDPPVGSRTDTCLTDAELADYEASVLPAHRLEHGVECTYCIGRLSRATPNEGVIEELFERTRLLACALLEPVEESTPTALTGAQTMASPVAVPERISAAPAAATSAIADAHPTELTRPLRSIRSKRPALAAASAHSTPREGDSHTQRSSVRGSRSRESRGSPSYSRERERDLQVVHELPEIIGKKKWLKSLGPQAERTAKV